MIVFGQTAAVNWLIFDIWLEFTEHVLELTHPPHTIPEQIISYELCPLILPGTEEKASCLANPH